MNRFSLKSNQTQDSWARCLHFKPIKTYQKIRESSSCGILLAETVWGWWHESWSFLQIKSVSKFVRFTLSEPPIIIIDIAVTCWITYLFLSQRISVVTKWQAVISYLNFARALHVIVISTLLLYHTSDYPSIRLSNLAHVGKGRQTRASQHATSVTTGTSRSKRRTTHPLLTRHEW